MTSQVPGVAAAILNGGKATRMHRQDKSRLLLGGRSILHRQLAWLRPRFAHIAMVGADSGEPGVQFLEDRQGGRGPVDGIAAALSWSPEPWLLVVASDMPSIMPALVDLLLRRRTSEAHIVGACSQGRAQPLLALYHRSVLPAIDRCLTQAHLRASDLLLAAPEGILVTLLDDAELRQVDPNLRSFQNLNTPEDVLTSEPLIE